jgi:hypothetical protein
MTVRIGDGIFVSGGVAAVVRERDPISGRLTVERETKAVQHDLRHGFINGLSVEERQQFDAVLDDIKGDSTAPAERVAALRAKLDELEQDPHNLKLTQYLKSEMLHLMNTFNIKPKTYTVFETKVR